MSEKWKLGLMVGLSENVDESFRKVTDVGLSTCQLACWKPDILGPGLSTKVREASKRYPRWIFRLRARFARASRLRCCRAAS